VISLISSERKAAISLAVMNSALPDTAPSVSASARWCDQGAWKGNMVRVFSLKNIVMMGFMPATRPISSSCSARKDVMYSTPIC
jgi:hypothetical protein